MTGWKEVSVGDLGKIITGNTPPRKNPEYYGDHTIFIKPTDISEEQKFTRNPEECYSDLGRIKYKNSLIPKGSTCVVTIGSIGKKMTMAHTDCFINQAMNAIIPNENYDREFVYYLLKYSLPKLKVLDSGTASGRENVSKSSFSSIRLLVPQNRELQHKIGSILASYDDLIENNLKRIKLLEEIAQRTYEEWFVKFRVNGEQLAIDDETGLPEGWELKIIGDACYISGGGTPSRTIVEYWDGGEIEWYSPTDLSKSKSIYQTGSADKITELGLSKSSAKLLEPNSFMMTSRATIGLFGIVDKPFCTNQGFINVTPFQTEHKEYLFYNFFSRVDEFKGYATGATFPELSKSKFKALDIIWPSDNALSLFHEITAPIHKQLATLSKHNKLLKEARDLLLPRLMSGEIEVEEMEVSTITNN